MNLSLNKGKKHVVDVLFVITLFCVFAAACLFVVIIGANVYRSTIDKMNANFEVHTSIAYVATKIRQNDASGSIHMDTLDGKNALVLEQEFDGQFFQTWIYHYDGALREAFINRDHAYALSPASGQKLVEVYSFTMDIIDSRLIILSAQSADGASARQLLGMRSS